MNPTALRRVAGDVHLAEDVSQQVFVALARQAGSLPEGLVLPAWLFSCTRNIAAQAVRTERRRRIREHQAQLMTALSDDTSPAPDWKLLRPVLDETIDELGERDREAIVLRFFEGYSYSEVGTRLRMTENAARMRVERALDKLHALLARRGIPSTAAAVGLALGGQVLVAAPAGLAGTITSAAVAGSAALAGSGGLVAFMSTIKVQVATIAVAGVVGGSAFTTEFQHQQALRQELTLLQSTNLPLTALQSEQRRLSALTIEVADLRRDDAALAGLRDEIAALQSVQTERAAAASQAVSLSSLPADASGTVFDLQHLDQRPAARSTVSPQYPAALRSVGATGDVIVDFVVDAEGNVQRAYAKRSSNLQFDEAAVHAVSQWKFEPGKKGGMRVSTHMQIPIVFTVPKENTPTESWF